MSNAEHILNAIRKMPLERSLRPCFLNRALKSYCKKVSVADAAALGGPFAGLPVPDLKRAARYIISRLEAAGTRGIRLDADELFTDMAQHAPDRELVRHLMLRGVTTYSKHVSELPSERVKHSLRGIEASKWQRVAQDIHDAVLYIQAFDQPTPVTA